MKILRSVEVCNTCRCVVISEESICNLFRKLDRCRRFHIADGDLSISFVSKKKIKAIHSEFLHDPSLTDVITFSGDFNLNFAGEIIICPLHAFHQSKIYGTNFQEEIKLYLIHGYLHLCGLEDKTDKEVKEMRSGENFCMNFLKKFPLQISLKN